MSCPAAAKRKVQKVSGLRRIQGLARMENTASIRVLEKNGYQREGVLRGYPFGREFHDAVMLAAVR